MASLLDECRPVWCRRSESCERPRRSTRRRPARVLTYKYDGDDGESRYYVDVTMGTLLQSEDVLGDGVSANGLAPGSVARRTTYLATGPFAHDRATLPATGHPEGTGSATSPSTT